MNGFFGAHGVDDHINVALKGVVDFDVFHAQADDHFDLLANQGLQIFVVVAFVDTTGNPNDGFVHALERIPSRVDVGGFGVIDELDSLEFAAGLQAVLDVLEVAEAFANAVLANVYELGDDGSSHAVVLVVLSTNGEVFHIDLCCVFVISIELDAAIGDPGAQTGLVSWGKAVGLGLWLEFAESETGFRVVGAVDKGLFWALILCDAHFACAIRRHTSVALQMVGGDVGENGNVQSQVVAVVKLKAGQLQYVGIVLLVGHLASERLADVAT